MEGSFEISSVLKSKSGCAESVTLFTTEGNKIIIDASSGLAAAYIEGVQHILIAGEIETERRHLYRAGEATPRLYSRHEFFLAKDSLEHRRLSAATSSGWVSIALSMGNEILESRGDCIGVFESAYVRGKTADEEETPFEMYYDEVSLVMKIGSDVSYTALQFNNGSTENSLYATFENNTWQDCRIGSFYENETMEDLTSILKMTTVDGYRVMQTSNGDDVVIIHEVEINANLSTRMGSVLPSHDECEGTSRPLRIDPQNFVENATTINLTNYLANSTVKFPNASTNGGRRLSSNFWSGYWSNYVPNHYGFDYVNVRFFFFTFISLSL
jgi:hypothetical protein